MAISNRLSNLAASKTLAISAAAARLRQEGVMVVDFGAGQPDFETPEHIKQAAWEAMKNGHTRYTATEGTLKLREAICSKLARDNQLSYQPDEITVSSGAKQSLYNAVAALFNPGDMVIVPAPYWVSYIPQLQMLDVKPLVVQTQSSNGFLLTADQLEKAITPQVKGLILNSPNNPTGAAYSAEQLSQLAEVILRHDLWVISDEIYEKLLYDGRTHCSIAAISQEMKDRTVVINGVSKSHAMTGWRIGYSASPKPVAKAMNRFQGHITSCASSIAQAATVEALDGDCSFFKDWLAQFNERRLKMCKGLNDIPGISCRLPEGAFYVFADVDALLCKSWKGVPLGDSGRFGEWLLEEAAVAVVPGTAFGADNFIRLSYATSMDQIIEGLARIAAAVARLV